MTMVRRLAVAAAASTIVFTSGCATIAGDETQSVSLSSEPSDARVEITDGSGKEVFAGTTPTQVTLKKSDGSYFGGKTYSVEVSKDGFEPVTVPLTTSPNGWYIGGNFVFGGLIGWLAVDPFNGGMYTLSPSEVTAELETQVSVRDHGRSLRVVLLEDVPSEMRDSLKRVN